MNVEPGKVQALICELALTVLLILGAYQYGKNNAPKVPPLPAIEQNQGQTADCSLERTIAPDGTIKEKLNFHASQSQAQKITPSPAAPVAKPEHSLMMLAQVDSNDLKPFANIIYGQKFHLLDIDGLKYHLGAGFQPESINFRVSTGLSYEW